MPPAIVLALALLASPALDADAVFRNGVDPYTADFAFDAWYSCASDLLSAKMAGAPELPPPAFAYELRIEVPGIHGLACVARRLTSSHPAALDSVDCAKSERGMTCDIRLRYSAARFPTMHGYWSKPRAPGRGSVEARIESLAEENARVSQLELKGELGRASGDVPTAKAQTRLAGEMPLLEVSPVADLARLPVLAPGSSGSVILHAIDASPVDLLAVAGSGTAGFVAQAHTGAITGSIATRDAAALSNFLETRLPEGTVRLPSEKGQRADVVTIRMLRVSISELARLLGAREARNLVVPDDPRLLTVWVERVRASKVLDAAAAVLDYQVVRGKEGTFVLPRDQSLRKANGPRLSLRAVEAPSEEIARLIAVEDPSVGCGRPSDAITLDLTDMPSSLVADALSIRAPGTLSQPCEPLPVLAVDAASQLESAELLATLRGPKRSSALVRTNEGIRRLENIAIRPWSIEVTNGRTSQVIELRRVAVDSDTWLRDGALFDARLVATIVDGVNSRALLEGAAGLRVLREPRIWWCNHSTDTDVVPGRLTLSIHENRDELPRVVEMPLRGY